MLAGVLVDFGFFNKDNDIACCFVKRLTDITPIICGYLLCKKLNNREQGDALQPMPNSAKISDYTTVLDLQARRRISEAYAVSPLPVRRKF